MRWLPLLAALALAPACVVDATVLRTDTDPGDTGVDTGDPPDTDDPDPPADIDGDGFTEDEDCDDRDPTVYPGARERCDLIDQDCDGVAYDEEVCPCSRIAEVGDLLVVACVGRDDFFDARAVCDDGGLDLVSIADAEENEAVQDLVADMGRGPAIIGLTDQNREGRFSWVDTTPVTFLNWETGEPNDFGRGEDCVQIYPWNGRWNDASCDLQGPFVCGWRAR